MAKRRLKDVKQTVNRPNKSPQTLITDLGKEKPPKIKIFPQSSQAVRPTQSDDP
jgi:hypothetical protein